jgi:acyl dehydratase
MNLPGERLYWEDLRVGLAGRSPGRTVTEADVVAFAGLSGDFNPLHTDADYAREHSFAGERVAHGLLGLSIASGLFTRTAVGIGLQEQVLAMLSLEWSFVGPIRLGDAIALEFEIASLRETSKPERGVVAIERTLVRGDGTLVQRGTTTLMVARRPAPEAAA